MRPIKGGLMFFFLNTLTAGTMMLTPLVIELSIAKTNSYAYPIWIVSGMALVYTLCIAFVPTPKHDTLRSLKREVQRTMSAEMRFSETMFSEKISSDTITTTVCESPSSHARISFKDFPED